MGKRKNIIVFEYQNLHIGDQGLKEDDLKALSKFHGTGQNFPYYKLISKGIGFKSYVGVLQIGDLQIEILPKVDRSGDDEPTQTKWRNVLIQMLLAVGDLDAQAPSSSALQLHANSILELYIAIYLKELDYLLHRGLVKKYRKIEGNVTALKGSLLFGKHLQQNVIHQERFYVRHTTYDREHKLHQILYKALGAVSRLNQNLRLKGLIGELMLHFPEMPDLHVDEATFTGMKLDRKTQSYKTALGIAKLILLHYHPDLRNGKNDVLALMFDMNVLWERFVFKAIQKNLPSGWMVREQVHKGFWRSQYGHYSGMKPDILLRNDKLQWILDTKWKNIGDGTPTPEDLRQLYAYRVYFKAEKVALLYPGKKKPTIGWYLPIDNGEAKGAECSVIQVNVPTAVSGKKFIQGWQNDIWNLVGSWMGLEKIKDPQTWTKNESEVM
jgi:5-methylcytosine-specific restriction enzyme subunit McrC